MNFYTTVFEKKTVYNLYRPILLSNPFPLRVYELDNAAKKSRGW